MGNRPGAILARGFSVDSSETDTKLYSPAEFVAILNLIDEEQDEDVYPSSANDYEAHIDERYVEWAFIYVNEFSLHAYEEPEDIPDEEVELSHLKKADPLLEQLRQDIQKLTGKLPPEIKTTLVPTYS